MERVRYYDKLFLYGAAWNWLAALSFSFGYKLIFPLLGMELPRYPVFLTIITGAAPFQRKKPTRSWKRPKRPAWCI